MNSLVIFDMIGVLTTEPHLVSVTIRNLLPELDITKIKENYEQYKVGEIINFQFWQNLGIKNPENIENTLIDQIKLREEVPQLLESLKDKVTLAILSNIPKEWGNSIIKKFKLTQYFDKILLSGDCGISKSNPKIYELLLKDLQHISPNNMFFIDDDPKKLKVSKNFGIKTVWLNKRKTDETYKPDFVINNLSEVTNIIDPK